MGGTGETSTFWKFFIGCAIGAGALLMLAVASCIGFVVWMNRPGTLIEPGRLTSPETVGIVDWTLRLEDPGTQQFVTGLLEHLQSARQRTIEKSLPPFFQTLSQFQQRRNEAKLRAMFPIKVGVVVEPAKEPEAGAPQVLGYVSLKGVGHQIVFVGWMMKLLLGWTGQNASVQYGGERILTLTEHRSDQEEAAGFFIRGNDIFFGSQLPVARTAVDRLNAGGTAPHTPTRVDELLTRVPEASAMRGAILNEHGELGRALGGWIPKSADDPNLVNLLEAARDITIEGGFQADRSLQLDLGFDCATPECGRALQALVRPAAAPEARAPTDGPDPVVLTYTSEGARGGIHVRLSDPGATIERLFTPPILEGRTGDKRAPDDSRH